MDKCGQANRSATHVSDARSEVLNAVAKRLNGRPRKTLNDETQAERFQQTIASNG
jgi:IS30 family transposase